MNQIKFNADCTVDDREIHAGEYHGFRLSPVWIDESAGAVADAADTIRKLIASRAQDTDTVDLCGELDDIARTLRRLIGQEAE